MTNEDNPYRFVDVQDEEQTVEETVWDPADYAAPEGPPVFGIDEIALLGERWSGLTAKTFLILAVMVLLSPLLLPAIESSPRLGPVRSRTTFRPEMVAIYFLGVVAMQVPMAIDVYRLARALRYPPVRALAVAAFYTLPIANVLVLLDVGPQAISTLRRHGIRAHLFGVLSRSLPRPIAYERRSVDGR